MELGATDFLTKPFSPKKLYARTAELAGRRAGRATARSSRDERAGPWCWPAASARASGRSAPRRARSSCSRSSTTSRCSRDTLDAPGAARPARAHAGAHERVAGGRRSAQLAPALPRENMIAEPQPAGTAAALAWAAREIARARRPRRRDDLRPRRLGDRRRRRLSRGAARARPRRREQHACARHRRRRADARPIRASATSSPASRSRPRRASRRAVRREARPRARRARWCARATSGTPGSSSGGSATSSTRCARSRRRSPRRSRGRTATTCDALLRRRATPVAVDVGVLERSAASLVMPGDFGWDDVGTWAALRRVRAHDAHGNAASGPVHALDAQRQRGARRGNAVVLYGVSRPRRRHPRRLTLVTTTERVRRPQGADRLAARRRIARPARDAARISTTTRRARELRAVRADAAGRRAARGRAARARALGARARRDGGRLRRRAAPRRLRGARRAAALATGDARRRHASSRTRGSRRRSRAARRDGDVLDVRRAGRGRAADARRCRSRALRDGARRARGAGADDGARGRRSTGWWLDEVWDSSRTSPRMLARRHPACSARSHRPRGATPARRWSASTRRVRRGGATVEPYVVFDATAGPDPRAARRDVQAFTRLVGPCYVGEDSHGRGDRIAAARSARVPRARRDQHHGLPRPREQGARRLRRALVPRPLGEPRRGHGRRAT